MEIIKKHNDLPDWGKSFLSIFQNQFNNRDIEKEAAINVKNLPKVVWNDNTFYVALDSVECNADVLNEYGNVVTALKNVSSISDVEKQLNKHIVADLTDTFKKQAVNISAEDTKLSKLERKLNSSKITKLDDELDKIADSILPNNNSNLEKKAENETNSNEDNSNEMKTTDPSLNGSVNNVTNTPENTTSDITNQELNNAAEEQQKTAKQLLEIQNSNKSLRKDLRTQKLKVAKLQQQIEKLAGLVQNLTDEIHAYTNPGNIYDLNCEKLEVDHFNNTAVNSQKAIDIEHSVDLTTPFGRTSLKDTILKDIESIQMPDEILVNDNNNSSVLEININSNDKENNDEENDTDQVTVINDDNDQEIEDDNTNSSSLKEEEDLELPEEDQNNDSDENNDILKDKDINSEDVVELPANDSKINIKKLNGKEASVFKKQVCPICKNKSLRLTTKTASVQNVICKHCQSNFGVNLKSAKIFKYM